MMLIRARCGAQSRPSPRAERSRCSVWPKWNIDILSLQAERDFFRYKPSIQVISRSGIDKTAIYCRFPARALQPLSDGWKFQDNFANILQVLTPNFHSNSVSALCEGWLRYIAPVMQGLLTPRNSHLQWFCTIGHRILPESDNVFNTTHNSWIVLGGLDMIRVIL